MYFKRLTLFFVLLLSSSWAAAQATYTEHTYRLDSETARPAASIDDVAWLTGNWVGKAFGQHFEQAWNPASAGTMVGMFKLIDAQSINFYELLVLVQDADSLSLKVKHFSSDFHAWEEKTEFTEFKLVKLEPYAIHFSGLSFYRHGPNKIDGYIVMKNKDGEVREEHLVYSRR